MIGSTVAEAFKQYVPEKNIYLQEPMSKHTTLGVGGPADCLIHIEKISQLSGLLQYLYELQLPVFILGNGSNLLVGDKGVRAVILQLGDCLDDIRVEGNRILAGAGAKLSLVAKKALEHGLSGLEFASGIPGTVGGGVVMNAGAYGGEMSQVVASVEVVDQKGVELTLSGEDMEFGYRHSVIRDHPFTVTRVEFLLRPGEKEEIKALMEDLANRRREKQPLNYPSAGSTFKRPEGYFAGELIMKAGLSGYQIGGAAVSEKHCGFLVNMGGASALDFKQLIGYVQDQVQEKFGVRLDPEVILLGDFT